MLAKHQPCLQCGALVAGEWQGSCGTLHPKHTDKSGERAAGPVQPAVANPSGQGVEVMRARFAVLGKPAIITRRLFSALVRSFVIASMSFAFAFGFLSGTTAPGAHY